MSQAAGFRGVVTASGAGEWGGGVMGESTALVLTPGAHPVGTRVLLDGTARNGGYPWEGVIREWSEGGRVRVGSLWYEPDTIGALEILPPGTCDEVTP